MAYRLCKQLSIYLQFIRLTIRNDYFPTMSNICTLSHFPLLKQIILNDQHKVLKSTKVPEITAGDKDTKAGRRKSKQGQDCYR